MKLDNKNIGEQIKRIRVKRNVSQQTLAELTGECISAISRVERGQRQVRLDTLVSIANALKVDVEEILTFHIENRNIRTDEFTRVLDGCTPEEQRIILKTANALKAALKSANFENE